MGGPADIVDLFLEGLDLMADVLELVFGVPDADGPIVRASQEDGAIVLVPEGRAADAVDGAGMAVVSLKVLL